MVGTALGALIGMGGTLFAERARWRRNLGEQERGELRTAYARYLDAATLARDAISLASRNVDLEPGERAELARSAIHDNAVYARQYELELVAPAEVVTKAREATKALGVYRDAVMAGATYETAECAGARRAFRGVRQSTMDAMRVTLDRAR
ncbi:hypothetical protein GCM10010394_29610 [Streptomyces crystallinus]|uniref:Uncharacterized protein n=1 Tax=Streptomyces crystallinus TaxID=68191 RepID=A0ABP3R0X2_9ACTN